MDAHDASASTLSRENASETAPASSDAARWPTGRKRSAPDEMEEEPDYDASGRLSLNTGEGEKADGSRDAMCLCTPAPKIPRPRNAFILYRQHHQSQVIADNPKLSNPEISKIIGQKWKAEREDVKEDWKKLAEEEKQRHQLQYPDYRYQPRRGSKAQGSRSGPSPTDDQDRCSKCSGRFISTPRTPSTPSGASTPVLHKGNRDAARRSPPDHPMAGYTPYTPRLPSVRDVSLWETAVPEMKRRRANGTGDYHSVPWVNEPYRFQASRVPVEAYTGHRTPIPYPDSPRDQGTPPRQFNPAMPPPPRPAAAAQWNTQRRPKDFDESLRLPPLQTAIPSSPRRTPLTDSRHAPTPTSSLSSSTTRASPPRSFEAQIMTLPFKRKLEVLARVCRPAPTVGSTNPRVEVRGAFVAVEGHDTKMVQAIGRAVEKGLKASEEFALKVWEGDISSREDAKKDGDGDGNGGEKPESIDDDALVRGLFPSKCFRTVLDWHDKVQQISSYITSRPPGPAEKEDNTKHTGQSTDDSKTPVALIGDGFSLTVSDRLACISPITDTYQLQDHWQWMASLWRGTICPDLVIYVKPSGEDEINSLGTVEFMKRMGLIVVRMGWAKPLEEATERRLVFEVMEWLREGSFRDKVPKTWRHELA